MRSAESFMTTVQHYNVILSGGEVVLVKLDRSDSSREAGLERRLTNDVL